jgi:hypothetical protein
MARYFFHVEDGEPISDPVHEDLADDASARLHAERIASELSRNNHGGEPWRVVVKSQSGEVVGVVPMVWKPGRTT